MAPTGAGISPADLRVELCDRSVICRSSTARRQTVYSPAGRGSTLARGLVDANPGHRGRAPHPRVPAPGARGGRVPVDAADDGAAGLGLALAEPYELVVLDLLLPRLDGFRVLRRAAPRPAGDAGADPLGPLRPADEAAQLRARRERLPLEAVLVRRARRARARAPPQGTRHRRVVEPAARRARARSGPAARAEPEAPRSTSRIASFGSSTTSPRTPARS